MALLDPSNMVKTLEETNPAPPEVIEEAKDVVAKQLRGLSLSNSVLSSIIIGMLRRVYTTAVETYAVTLAGDGFPMLLINPHFAIKLGDEGGVFVLCHEAKHLLNCHLYVDPALNGDPMWEMATEGTINFSVMELLNRRSLPEVDGESTGVDPKKMYERYRDDLKKNGKDPVPFDDFIKTDLGCYSELCRMTKPPKQRGGKCVHMTEGAGGAGGQGQQGDQPDDGPVQLDQQAVDSLMGEALDVAMNEAKANGNKTLKDELLSIADRSEGSAKADKVWGDLGLGALRGETVRTRKTQYWEQWLTGVMAEKLREGQRLRYQKKVWWDPRVAHRGDEPYKYGAIYIDASGSMHQNVLDYIAKQIGETENLEVVWNSFDATVWPFEAGEAFRGGGGTSFQIIDDHVEEMEEPPDFVLVITDGYAPHMTPTEPDKWIWLIVPGGDTWPDKHRPMMDCREVEIPNEAAA
jgi:predicted metal-dependent peptidase